MKGYVDQGEGRQGEPDRQPDKIAEIRRERLSELRIVLSSKSIDRVVSN